MVPRWLWSCPVLATPAAPTQAYAHVLLLINEHTWFVDDGDLFLLVLLVDVLSYLAWVTGAVQQITAALDIYCFSIKRKAV